MGTDALGYLLYSPDGCFSVTISRRDRAGFAAGDLLSGTTEENARAVEGFVAYAGRYSLHGDLVIHHVELSLFLNCVGSDQQRWVELAGIGRPSVLARCCWSAGSRCPAWSGSGLRLGQAPADRDLASRAALPPTATRAWM